YGEVRPGLVRAIHELKTVLVISRLSQTAAFAFLPGGIIYSERLDVIASSSFAMFAVLQSRVHEFWARLLGSSMKDDLLYTPSDCFETFPFPANLDMNTSLQESGREYHQFRAWLMMRNYEGLTKTYNRFHDPDEQDLDIGRLRQL